MAALPRLVITLGRDERHRREQLCAEEERRGEQHVAVRFGDMLKYRVLLQHVYYCPVEEDVSHYVNEAVADRERGWVNFIAGPPLCPSLLGRVTGAVRIESIPAEVG